MITELFYGAQTTETDRIDLPEYLAAQDLFPKFYNRCKETGEERAAFGSLVTLPFVPKLTQDIDSSLCFYGALSFPAGSLDMLWSDFPPALFFLPLYEIRQTPEKTVFRTRPLPYCKALKPSSSLSDDYSLGDRFETPDRKRWMQNLESVLPLLESGDLRKVVLARKTSFSVDPYASPFRFLKKLLSENPSTATFAFQMSPGALFLGSSPETLYTRTGNLLYGEALAGTGKKGETPLEDDILRKALLSGEKENREVDIVKEFLRRKLSNFSEELSFSERPVCVSTETLHHLRYECRALLRSSVTDTDLLEALHPTPAVNGLPEVRALATLRSLEPFNRGLYAGSVGWISSPEAHFTVSIRSSLIKDGFLHAFSGAGIVSGSDPESEWEELERKIAHWKMPCPI